MQATLIVSLAAHVLLFMHMSGVLNSDAVTSIELTMRDVSKPFTRSIPRPRTRHNAPQIHDVEKAAVPDRQVPKPDICAEFDDFSSPVTEAVSVQDVGDIRPAEAASIGFAHQAAPVFASKADYFEMVRMRIETRKTYPESARLRHMQGRIKVAFTIEKNGHICDLEVTKGLRHQILNRAARKAVENSAPFPPPPGSLFKNRERLNLTIIISFELMGK